MLIATNLLDLPPELVALIYRYRYTVELFFRLFKHLLGMRHLLSQKKQRRGDPDLLAVIACLLIGLQTGRRPDKATVEMLGWYLLGLATEQDVVAHLNRPDNPGVKLRAKDASCGKNWAIDPRGGPRRGPAAGFTLRGTNPAMCRSPRSSPTRRPRDLAPPRAPATTFENKGWAERY